MIQSQRISVPLATHRADAAGALGGAIGAFATGAAIPLIPAAALLAGVGTSAVAAIVVAATS